MALRNYTAKPTLTNITTALNGTDAPGTSTTVGLASTANLPAAPFTAGLDLRQGAEEVVLVTALAGGTATITRGYNGTSVSAHASGTGTFEHVTSAIDFTEANAHINAASGAHAASAVSVSPTGLTVVTGSDVQTAFGQLDAWAVARPTNESGLLSALPANGARPNGSTYLATDQYGGTTYRMVAGVWVPEAAGVQQASGQIIAGPVQFAAVTMDLKAVGATVTDVPGMTLSVPASTRPVLLRAYFNVVSVSGTATAGGSVRPTLAITDASNVILGVGIETFMQATTASANMQGELNPECYLPAPVAAATYKLRAYLVSAAPANWTSVALSPGYTGAGTNNFYAQVV